MKILQIHDEIEVNESAERVVCAEAGGYLCAAPGLGLWAGRHLFYVKAFMRHQGMAILPIVGNEYSTEDICKALDSKNLSIANKSVLLGIDIADIELLQSRIDIEIVEEPEETEEPENAKAKKKGKF